MSFAPFHFTSHLTLAFCASCLLYHLSSFIPLVIHTTCHSHHLSFTPVNDKCTSDLAGLETIHVNTVFYVFYYFSKKKLFLNVFLFFEHFFYFSSGQNF